MKLDSREVLRRLGAGEPIEALCRAAGLTPSEFDRWWSEETRRRVPNRQGPVPAPVGQAVEIVRDAQGIPHVFAERDEDLFFGYGYAMAEDRLWQLDYYRRKGLGRLAEILGPEAVPLDLVARTVGLNRIAAAEAAQLPAETRRLLDAFCAGINWFLDQMGDLVPIEFDLLDYRPERWSPVDSLAILGELRWYLTGRFPVIAVPELARRTLGDGPLYQAFLLPEADEETIVPSDFYPRKPATGEPVSGPIDRAGGSPEESPGSNNWVVAASRSASGQPLLASDPHIGFSTLSCWYEAHLSGGSFNAVGTGYVGVPGLLFGRNEHVAWGITNNICSQRDLYQEQPHPQRPGQFLFDGRWEPAREVTELIAVKGREPMVKTVRLTRNGPIVDEILPPALPHENVSLRWLGATFCDEVSSMLAFNRARSCAEFHAGLRSWRVPTLSFVFADAAGHIAYRASGGIPIRENWHRGYRCGWDPAEQWRELVPFEGMPALDDPPHGWIRTANNRTAGPDYPYPLSGCWLSGYRGARIRRALEASPRLSPDACRDLQLDVLSLRAVEAVPLVLRALRGSGKERAGDEPVSSSVWQQAIDQVAAWDCRMAAESPAAALFEVFFQRWCETIAAERFASEAVELVAGAIGGLAMKLLGGDEVGWFPAGAWPSRLRGTFQRTLDELQDRFGPDIAAWNWGRLHRLRLRHPLSPRGELGKLLDWRDEPVGGNSHTVMNMTCGPGFEVYLGPNYRLIADLAEPVLRAADAAGQSGHPGSPHYCDQFAGWLAGQYHELPLARGDVEVQARLRLVSGEEREH